jgi:hypothetical protein
MAYAICSCYQKKVPTFGGITNMLTFLVGFVGMVLIPALILSLIMTRLIKSPVEFPPQEDNLRFKISSDTKS